MIGFALEDVVAQLDALAADVDGGTGDEATDLVLATAAELQRIGCGEWTRFFMGRVS